VKVVLQELTDLLEETRHLILLRFRLQGDDGVLFMSTRRLASQGDASSGRAMPSMLHMKPGWEKEHWVAREVGHVVGLGRGGGGGGGGGGDANGGDEEERSAL
jgi:hypothetical protein